MKFRPVFLTPFIAFHLSCAAVPDLSTMRTAQELEAFIANTTDSSLRKSLLEHSQEIQAAFNRHPHVVAVIPIVESAQGKIEKANTTPESLKQALGGPLAIFDTLTMVDLSIPNAGPHDARKSDPYDASFFEHLGNITTLESLNIIATKLNDDWIAPLGKLTNLRTLRFTNNGKLTDEGLEKLAPLRNLETFSFVGTQMHGLAYAKFEGWTKVTRVSHRGSAIDDDGLRELCEHLPNLESLSLAHAKFTDEGAVHLAKLTKLRSLEIGSRNATAACLRALKSLPLESLQLGDGLDSAAGISALPAIASLKKLSITNGSTTTDADLQTLASLRNLESLQFDKLSITEERIPKLASFSFLQTLTLALRPGGYPPEIRAKIRELLPAVEVKFVPQ
jgi:hypothetical protein